MTAPAFFRRGWVRLAGLGAALLLIVMAAGAWAMTGALGRTVLISLADGRNIAGYGELSLDELTGNVLSDFSIGRLEIRDGEGVWLRAEEARIAWRFGSVFARPIHIDAVEVAALDIARRPVRTETDSGGGSAPALRLERFAVQRLRLAEGVAGPAAEFALESGLSRSADGALTLQARALRTDREGDRAELALDRAPDGDLAGRIDISAPPGGVLADLLQLGESGASLQGEVNGSVQSGQASFRLRVGEMIASRGEARWADENWSLQAGVNPAALPLIPAPLAPIAVHTDLSAEGGLAPFTIDRAAARSDMLSAEAHDILGPAWRADLALTPAGAGLAQAYGLELESARASLRRRTSSPARDDGATHFAQIELGGLSTPWGGAGSLNAEIDIRLGDGEAWLRPDGQIAGLDLPEARLQALFGDQAAFEADIRLQDGLRSATLQGAELAGQGWRLEASGAQAADPPGLSGRARLTLADIEALGAGVSGPLDLSLSMPDPNRLSLTASSENLTSDSAADRLLGPVRAEILLDLAGAAPSLPLIRVETGAAILEARAAQSAQDQNWSASGDGVIDLAAFQIAGLEGQAAAGFGLETGADGVTLRSQFETAELALGASRITAPVLRSETRISDGEISGAWRFDALAGEDPVLGEGGFELASGGASLTLNSGRWREAQMSGAVQLAEDALIANLAVFEDGPARQWMAELNYRGALADPLSGHLAGELDARNLILPGGDLSAAHIALDGPLAALSIESRAQGHWLGPFTLEARSEASIAPGTLSLATGLDGVWNERPITALRPVRITRNEDRAEINAELALGEARARIAAQTGDETRFDFSISETPADWVTELAGLPPASGQWSLSGGLARTGGVWNGQIAARLRDIRPAEGSVDGALNAEALLILAEQASLEMSATAGGLDAGANLERPGPVTDLAALTHPGWRGGVDLVGPLDTLARLYLPPTESLQGVIEGQARFDAGEVDGSVEIRDGLYRSQTSGVRLTPISLEAVFSEDRLQIREARAGDGNGGVLNASGAIGFGDSGLFGDVDIGFNRFNAVARPELNVQASGEARLHLQGRRLSVTGQSRIDRLLLTPVAPSGANIPQIEVEEINRPEQLDPPYRRPILVELDYAVRADDSLLVSSRAFSSEWSANVRVQGPVNRLRLDGEAELLAGQASVLTRIFNMEEGRISFDGPIETTEILLVGRHQRAGLDVTARAEGPVAQPRLSFESDPSLPEDEVLSRLLFDQDAAALSPLQSAQLAAQLSGRNWLGALGEAGRRIGVDRLDVREGENGEIALRGGRRINDRVYLELETGTAAALGAARIEWSVTPDIVVLSRLTGDTNAELAIRWRREFD